MASKPRRAFPLPRSGTPPITVPRTSDSTSDTADVPRRIAETTLHTADSTHRPRRSTDPARSKVDPTRSKTDSGRSTEYYMRSKPASISDTTRYKTDSKLDPSRPTKDPNRRPRPNPKRDTPSPTLQEPHASNYEQLDGEARRHIYNSLLCLLDGLASRLICVELRNECSVTGTLERLERGMTLCMSDVTFYDMFDKSTTFETFRVQGSQIRYVQIPDDVDILPTMEGSINLRRRIHGRVNSGQVRGSRGRGRGGARGGRYQEHRMDSKKRFTEWFEQEQRNRAAERRETSEAEMTE